MDNPLLRRKTIFERKMTLRRQTSLMNKPQSEIQFVDSSLMYNILLRAIPMKVKNSFIIYDFSPAHSAAESEATSSNNTRFTGENIISLCEHPQALEVLLRDGGIAGIDTTKQIQDFSKALPKPKEDLFARRARVYNFICCFGQNKTSNNSSNSEEQQQQRSTKVFKIFTDTVKSFNQENESNPGDILKNSGLLKVPERHFQAAIEGAINDCSFYLDPSDLQNLRAAGNLYAALKANKIRDVYFLRHSPNRFFEFYPFMAEYISKLTNSISLSLPNEVLAGRFYYGNWKHASSAEVMKRKQITHIVNATQEVENYFQKSDNPDGVAVKYHQILIEDVEEANMAAHFKDAYEFLANALKDPNSKVFVHCAQGKSRSATIVCVFFMRFFGWTYGTAIKYIADRREIACPNDGFVEQLKAFENNACRFEGEIDTQEHWKNNLELMNIILEEETPDKKRQILGITEEEVTRNDNNATEAGNQANGGQEEDLMHLLAMNLLEKISAEQQNATSESDDDSGSESQSQSDEDDQSPCEGEPDNLDENLEQAEAVMQEV